MDELYSVYAAAAVIVLYFLVAAARGRFDPFAPVWLFLLGYGQVYIVQALTFHEWAVGARGLALVAAAGWRALWGLFWFLLVYQLGIARMAARALPSPPRGWSPVAVGLISPPLVIWGLVCAGVLILGGVRYEDTGARTAEALFHSIPFVMLVAAVMLIVTGRAGHAPRPLFLWSGLVTAAAYVLIWMFNGKRSHALIGVLATVCAFYITRLKRPSWPVLAATGFAGALVVAIAIGWRGNLEYERSLMGFIHFVGDFKVARILENLNVTKEDNDEREESYETTEYGGFLLMLDTVPEKSDYDYGANYIRVVSTFIPRIFWLSKPLYGRAQWTSAWIAGSEMLRDEDFTGPAIGILGAAQLNGGAIGTAVVLACVALLLRTAYEYLLLYPDVPWVQCFWSITYYNAWFMTVNDDPLIWFYYNWGMTALPVVVLLWWVSKPGASAAPAEPLAAGAGGSSQGSWPS
jgi:hypothetical protein